MKDVIDQPQEGRKRKARKGFFALDVHQFEQIKRYNLGVEEAATYLSLVKSTDQGNVASSGGVRSVMDYCGLSRAEVKRAIRNLEQNSLIESLKVERPRARTAHRYNNLPFDEWTEVFGSERLTGVRRAIRPLDGSLIPPHPRP